MSDPATAPKAAPAASGSGGECHWCRREAPCECMTFVRDGGPWRDPITGTPGWSWRPWRCMCTCGRCQAPET